MSSLPCFPLFLGVRVHDLSVAFFYVRLQNRRGKLAGNQRSDTAACRPFSMLLPQYSAPAALSASAAATAGKFCNVLRVLHPNRFSFRAAFLESSLSQRIDSGRVSRSRLARLLPPDVVELCGVQALWPYLPSVSMCIDSSVSLMLVCREPC